MDAAGQVRNPEDIRKIVEAAHAAKQAQQVADDLKRQALAAINPAEKDKLEQEAELKEREARRHSRKAHRLASGTWQGAARGAGIGAAVGAGLGTVVGTLVGTIAAIPATGLGALIGIPVGWVHGPWAKMGSDGEGRQGRDEPGGGVVKDEGTLDEHDGGENGLESDLDEEMTDEETHRAVLEAVDLAETQETEHRDNDAPGHESDHASDRKG